MDIPPGEDPAPADPSQVLTREELGRALTAARGAAGLSVRDVVRRVPGLSLGTASGWFSGQHVPTRASTSTFEALLGVLGQAPRSAEWNEAVDRVRTLPGPRRGRGRTDAPTGTDPAPTATPARTPIDEPDSTGAPYVGLRPYGPADSPLFHGRAGETRQILDRMVSGRRHPLMVVGASGSGKSSVLAAGAVPVWESQGLAVVVTRPSRFDAASADSADVLVVDQLEEIWSAGTTPERRAAVLGALARHAAAGRPTAAVLRADFLQPALAEPVLRTALDSDPVFLGAPDREALAEIIVSPARSLGYSVEPALVTLLLDTMAPHGTTDRDGSLLPLLSHVLLLCWERSRRRRITVEDYYSTGGIEGAIRLTAEAVYRSLDQTGRADTRSLFLRLVDVRSAQTVRRRSRLAELPAGPLAVVGSYSAVGLLTVDDEAVTPTHEVVLSAWPRLADWIEVDRQSLVVLTRIRSGAGDWEDSGRADDALPSAAATAELLRWRESLVADSGVRLDRSETDYLEAARDYHDRLVRRDRRRLRILSTLASALAVVTVLALVSTVLALQASDQARTSRDETLSRSGAVAAREVLASDPALSSALALAAMRIAPTHRARSALLETTRTDVPDRFTAGLGFGRAVPLADGHRFVAVSSDGVARFFRPGSAAPAVDLRLEEGEVSALRDVELDPRGGTLVVAGSDSVHLIDVRDPDRPVVSGVAGTGSGPYHSVAVSPDGRTLAAGTGAGTIRRWTLEDPGSDGPAAVSRARSSESPALSSAPVESLAWMPDSRTLLATDGTRDVKVLQDAAAGPGPQVAPARWGTPLPTGDVGYPKSVAVNARGTALAVGTTGRQARVWRMPAGRLDLAREEPPLGGWNAFVLDVSFDAGGRLAAAGSDERVRVYTPDLRTEFELPASQIATSARFFGDGQVLTYSTDGTARHWRLDRPRGVRETDSIFQTASSADRRVGVLGVTARQEHYTILDTSGPVPRETARIRPDPGTLFTGTVAMSPDGRTVYAGTREGGVQIHDAAGSGPGDGPHSLSSLPVTTGVMVGTALTGDGRTLAACSESAAELGLVDVTDRERPTLAATLDLPTPCVTVDASPDGRLVTVATSGREVLVVDVSDPVRPRVTASVDTGLQASASSGFAHHSPLLATARGDGLIQIWDLSDPSSPRELSSQPSPPGEIYWTAFTEDDTRLLITSSTGQVSVYDVDDPAALSRWADLGSAGDPILYQARSANPAGDVLAVGTEGRVTSWELDVDRVVDRLCAGGIHLGDDEWRRYFPEAEPVPLCG